MSFTELERFINTAAENDDLKGKLSADMSAEDVVELGKQNGFDFTVDEAKQLAAAVRADAGELSEAELAQVAGGIGTWPTPELGSLKVTLKRSFAIDSTGVGEMDPSPGVSGAGGFSW